MAEWMSINRLMTGTLQNSEVTVRGWVRTKRDSKSVSFINLNDGSNQAGIQVVVAAPLSEQNIVAHLTTGSAIEVQGLLVTSPNPQQPYEIQVSSIKVYGSASGEDYPLQKKRTHLRVFKRNRSFTSSH